MNNNEFEKCEFYDKGITFNGDIRPSGYCLINYLLTQAGYKCPTIYCSDIRNCLYKQNLKLREENKGLKEQIEELANCILAENKGVPLNEGACINAVYLLAEGRTKIRNFEQKLSIATKALEAIKEFKKPCTIHCVECELSDKELNCYPNIIINMAQIALDTIERLCKDDI